MKNIVFSFNPPTPDGTLANARTATYLANLLGLPLVCDKTIAEHNDVDILFLVAGVFLYCRCLPELAVAIEGAKRVVWVQNDYTIMPPKDDGAAESPFRYAFRKRRMDGKPPVDFWTTMKSYAGRTEGGAYLNWNSMAYDPMTDEEFERSWDAGSRGNSVLYFGADRAGRELYFNRYFINQEAPVTISTFSKSMTRYNDHADVVGMFPRTQFNECMKEFPMGLYLEDKKSHQIFTSPATRFYEMLGNGLAMVFQPEAVPMLAEAGYKVGPYTVAAGGLNDALGRAKDIAAEQRAAWARVNPTTALSMAVKTEYKRLQELTHA